MLNGEILLSTSGPSGSRLTLLAIDTGLVGIFGLSARFTGGGTIREIFWVGAGASFACDVHDSCAPAFSPLIGSCDSVVGRPLNLFGGIGDTRGDFGPTLAGVRGLDLAVGREYCILAVGRGFDGDFGGSMVTIGGDCGTESEVVDRGRCRLLPPS